MIAATRERRQEGVAPKGTPRLSHSRINRYLTCPEQYRLYYVENLRLRHPAANLVFGQLVHQSLAGLFRNGEDPLESFDRLWAETHEATLTYGKRDSWEKLQAAGRGLLEKFTHEELPRLRNIDSVEAPFRLDITSLDEPFIGVIDLVAVVGGKKTVVDFKTSASSYEPHEASMSDQLTAYQLARPDAEQSALCVLVKTRQPKIEWYFARRMPEQLTEYLRKVGIVAREIASARFYKRPGMWCSWCDFLPVCMGDTKKANEVLMQKC